MAAAEGIARLDKIDGWPAPEEQSAWLGDPAAERTLLDAYRGGRMHHAWLIGGPKGIGKATLAYRFARFAFAHPDPASPDLAAAVDLAVPKDHPAFRKVAARAHPNLLVLERPLTDDRKRYRTELTVGEIRRTVAFFGSTGGEPGWRIAIVDPADDMNPSAANALLKVLEEPPSGALFFIVSHAPGRLLATIRSRCRRLELVALPDGAIVAAVGAAEGEGVGDGDLGLAARLAEGSLRRTLLLLGEGGTALYRDMTRLLAGAPDIDIAALHAFADKVTQRGADDAYDGFLDLLRDWLARRVRRAAEPDDAAAAARFSAVPLARWAEVWEKVNRSAAVAEELNLDRKQVVLSIFMTLARATRM